MDPISIGAVVFACTLAAMLLGNWLRNVVPERHLQGESRDSVNVGIGFVATMSALVLGLVTASANNSFDAVDTAVKHTAADLLAFDRLLARYGPEAAEIRVGLKRAVADRIETIWPDSASTALPDPSANAENVERLADAILLLEPRDASQRWMQARALDLSEDVFRARWLVFAGLGSSVPPLLLMVLLVWLMLIFGSFGLFAPRNPTALVMLIAAALSVSGAVFLVLELDGPFDGLLQVSSDPLRYALERLAL